MTTDPSRTFVTFRRGEGIYAVDVAEVRRVVPCPTLRALPAAPAFVAGGARFDEATEAVLDPVALFADDAASAGGATAARVVLVRVAGEAALGLLADEVHGVADIEDAEVHPPPPFVANTRRDAVSGLIHWEGHDVLVLDLSRLLTREERTGFASAVPPPG